MGLPMIGVGLDYSVIGQNEIVPSPMDNEWTGCHHAHAFGNVANLQKKVQCDG